MHLRFKNVNEAFTGLVSGIHQGAIPTEKRPSRVGDTLQVNEPVIVTYERPIERVLFNTARDCNPFMHLYEALWMLAGRNDLAPLQYYVSTFDQFSDDGKVLNGAYGYRWRHPRIKTLRDDGSIQEVDQLKVLVEHFKNNPNSRRGVLSMWNVKDDLLKIDTSKDVCCNTHAYFLLRTISADGSGAGVERVLDMTVCNRSNDLVWGALGANVVHFSFLQEYLAACIGVGLGVYNQFTNNLHVYTERWQPREWLNGYKGPRDMHSPKIYTYEKHVKTVVPLVENPAVFDEECASFVEYNATTPQMEYRVNYREPFLVHVAQPMAYAFHFHKLRDYTQALFELERVKADDWRIAGENWIKKRKKQWEEKNDAQAKQLGLPVESKPQ